MYLTNKTQEQALTFCVKLLTSIMTLYTNLLDIAMSASKYVIKDTHTSMDTHTQLV